MDDDDDDDDDDGRKTIQKLTKAQGPNAMSRALRHLVLRTAARAEAKRLRNRLAAAREEIRAKHDAWELARDTRVAQTAEIEWRDAVLGGSVMDLSRRLLVLTGGSRTDPTYVSAFPLAPAEGTGPVGGRDQARFVAGADSVVRADEGLAELHPLVDAIEAQAAGVDAAERGREELFVAEGRAKVDRDLAISRAQRAYNFPRAQLTVMFLDAAGRCCAAPRVRLPLAA